MKVLFISGPYRAYRKDGNFNINGIFENIMEARKVAKKYWDMGYAVFCPHCNTVLMDDDEDSTKWLEGDLEILRRCDTIVMMKNWQKSEGAKGELKLAQELGLEVIYD